MFSGDNSKKCMKIAFIGQKGIPVISGGVERRVEELSTRMVAAGHQVFVYARKDYTEYQNPQYKGVDLVYLPAIATKNLSTISHTFFATMHALFQDYDVIHFQAPGPSTLSWIIKFFKPKTALVATFNSQDFKHQKWGWFAQKYLQFGEWMISNVPDQTIVVSQLLKRYVRRKFRRQAKVINNGASVYDLKTLGQASLNHWGLKKKKYFLSVSRLVRHKGIHYLIEAFNQGQKTGTIPADFKLVIVGESAFTNDYVKYLQKLGSVNANIIFTKNQSGQPLAELFAQALAFVQPSEAEGLSNALLEAMGYGLVPIISNIPENRYPVDSHGLIFQNKNIRDLKQQLIFAINNPKIMRQLSAGAKKHIQANYSWDENARRTLEIYSNILQKKGAQQKICLQQMVEKN